MRNTIRGIVGLAPNIPADDKRLLAELGAYLDRDTPCRQMLMRIGGYTDKNQILELVECKLALAEARL